MGDSGRSQAPAGLTWSPADSPDLCREPPRATSATYIGRLHGCPRERARGTPSRYLTAKTRVLTNYSGRSCERLQVPTRFARGCLRGSSRGSTCGSPKACARVPACTNGWPMRAIAGSHRRSRHERPPQLKPWGVCPLETDAYLSFHV